MHPNLPSRQPRRQVNTNFVDKTTKLVHFPPPKKTCFTFADSRKSHCNRTIKLVPKRNKMLQLSPRPQTVWRRKFAIARAAPPTVRAATNPLCTWNISNTKSNQIKLHKSSGVWLKFENGIQSVFYPNLRNMTSYHRQRRRNECNYCVIVPLVFSLGANRYVRQI